MKVLIFSGTGDGRELCGFLNENGIETIACVATQYGKDIMGEMKNVKIYQGRLDEKEIEELAENADIVIDATHPYARNITKNVKTACKKKNKEYLRMVRDENEVFGSVVVKSIDEAVKYLNDKEGKIFVSTGSSEICKYSGIDGYKKRIRARVLNTEESRKKCGECGIEDVMYKMPPYSVEDNIKDFNGCEFLVTKSSGKVGGFDEKIEAAHKLAMEIIIIKRPDESGYTIDEIKRRILRKNG
ncbi:MAG: precorrin-6A reductase [Firmicutes bacterium]|nr:precorrin-6A reductase [Bacillota bacterium]